MIQSTLPNVGPGALKQRDVNPSATKKVYTCTYMYMYIPPCVSSNHLRGPCGGVKLVVPA